MITARELEARPPVLDPMRTEGRLMLAWSARGQGAARLRRVRHAYVCCYCESAPATGYVPAYRARVCEDCYGEHHGRGE